MCVCARLGTCLVAVACIVTVVLAQRPLPLSELLDRVAVSDVGVCMSGGTDLPNCCEARGEDAVARDLRNGT